MIRDDIEGMPIRARRMRCLHRTAFRARVRIAQRRRRGSTRTDQLPLDVFHAVVPWRDGHAVVWRHFAPEDSCTPRTWLHHRMLDGAFRPRGTARMLTPGEDPRLVVHDDRLFCVSWLVNPDHGAVDPHLLDVETGTQVTLTMPDDTLAGKNWVPFSHGGVLHMAHALEPVALLTVDVERGQTSWVLRTDPERLATLDWSNSRGGVGPHRGGSQGHVLDDRWLVGVGHRTCSRHLHQAFLYRVDLKTGALRIHDILPRTTRGLMDPTSCFWRSEDLWFAATWAPHAWDHACATRSDLYRLRDARSLLRR